MPGLRHAHTLQQLKNLYEYSPPGEYLIKIKQKIRTIKKQKSKKTNNKNKSKEQSILKKDR